jgi:hypothetical protein
MKLVALGLVLAACKPPTTPSQPVAPLPPDPGSAVAAGSDASAGSAAAAPVAKHVAWPKYPELGDAPASHPSGDPIALPAPVVKSGDHERRRSTSRFEQHYISGTTTRYQLTKRDFDLEVTVLAVDAGHASRLEVVTHKANESVALDDAPTDVPREEGALLDGTYTVSTGPSRELHDDTKVTRGPGMDVHGREQEELAGMLGDELRGGDPMADFMRAKQLRLGEVVTITEAEKKKLDAGTVPSTVTLALIAADPNRVTYQMDIEVDRHDDADVRVHSRGVVTFDRKTGAQLEQRTQTHKHEVNKYGDDDTFEAATVTFKR